MAAASIGAEWLWESLAGPFALSTSPSATFAPRCGKMITADYIGGPVTIEVLDAAGNVAAYYGLARSEQVAAHPNCTASAR